MINPFHLKYFYDSCQFSSISRAAELNRVSHSAVSQSIKAIEISMGVSLLQHSKRRFVLTSEGELLFQEAIKIFEAFENLTESINSKKNLESLFGTLKIGFSQSIAHALLMSKIVNFCNQNSNVHPQISIGNSNSLESLIDSRKIEIGFGIEDGSFAKFERQCIYKGNFILASSQPFKNKETFLVGDKGSEVHTLRKYLKKQIPNAKFYEIQSWLIMSKLAEEGLGVALIPDFFLEDKKSKLIIRYPNIKLPNYELNAYFRSKDNLTSVANKFLTLFKINNS